MQWGGGLGRAKDACGELLITLENAADRGVRVSTVTRWRDCVMEPVLFGRQVSGVLGPEVSGTALGHHPPFSGSQFPPHHMPNQAAGSWDLLAPVRPLPCGSRVTCGQVTCPLGFWACICRVHPGGRGGAS